MSEVIEAVETEEATSAKIAERLKVSAHQIWLAGLGAYAKAEEEGIKAIESLIKEGEDVEVRASEARKETIAKTTELREKANQSIEDIKENLLGSWGKVETVIDQRIEAVINFFGLPSKSDVDELIIKVEELNKAVKALAKAA